jgi:hypothetical protein
MLPDCAARSHQPPAPLDFTYAAALEVAVTSGGALAEGGCGPRCICRRGCTAATTGVGLAGTGTMEPEADGDSDCTNPHGSRRPGQAGIHTEDDTEPCGCGVAVPGGQQAYGLIGGGLHPAAMQVRQQ